MRGLVGFYTKPFKNLRNQKKLLRFAWPGTISWKRNSKMGQIRKGCFDFRALVVSHTKSIRKLVKIKKVALISMA